MTELETIQRAKMYMDKLANGINPIDDTRVSEEDIVNNVRLSRCFFFVSDVLRRVIENGGIEPNEKKNKKAKFSISETDKNRFDFSDSPIPISEVSKRLNMLIDPQTMKNISYNQIRDWLMYIGMLEESTGANGNIEKQPTEMGKSIGISVEVRSGNAGSYQVILYDRTAQQFILDNLDAIADMRKNAGLSEMHGKTWTPEQEQELIVLFQNGATATQIADKLKRSRNSIVSRLKKLGLAEK